MASPKDLLPTRYEVIKLKTGTEVVGMTRETDTSLEITLPMICHLSIIPGTPKTQATFYPYAPLTSDEKIIIPKDHVVHRSIMNDQFIPFYDSASSKWFKMIEEGSIPLDDGRAIPVKGGFMNKLDSKIRKAMDELIENATDLELDEFEEVMSEYDDFEFAEVPKDPKKIH